MTGFATLAALLLAFALAIVLWPLLRTRRAPAPAAAAVNAQVYRGQFAELERDLALGTLDLAQYDAARAELQQRVLEEVGDPAQAAAPAPAARRSKRLAILIGIALPVVAALLYWHLGDPRAIDAAKHVAPDAPAMTPEQLETMTAKLAQRMQDKPDDPVGWLMLGRAFKALGRGPEAVAALEQANRRKPGDAEILVEYAEAKAHATGSLQGEPVRLLEQALAVAPDDPKALTLAGGAAFEAHDYGRAIAHWERLQAQLPPESELGQAVATGLQRARSLAGGAPAVGKPAAGPSVRGRVSLSDALKNRAAPDDTVFVFARAADGPRMPLAAIRKRVKDLPADFLLDDSMAMTPELKLSAFERVVVVARVSRSGSAVPRSGDLQGKSLPFAPGGVARVSVLIDRVLP